ncbi:unnamed protein product [Leptosia nina]|uniref:Uncharacterized protein n=1 Tax=Leptosia nina TaxID=320188 RepID=A0AAV1J1R5_9NEOP
MPTDGQATDLTIIDLTLTTSDLTLAHITVMGNQMCLIGNTTGRFKDPTANMDLTTALDVDVNLSLHPVIFTAIEDHAGNTEYITDRL